MTTPSPAIGLAVPDDDDAFSTEDLAANWGKVDDYIGHLVVASALPAGWGADQTGLNVYQEDTGLSWLWNGSAFERTAARGWLGGDSAVADVVCAVTAPTYVTVIDVEIDFPRGGRRALVDISFFDIVGSAGSGRAIGRLQRDGVTKQEWAFPGLSADTVGLVDTAGGRSLSFNEAPGEGTYTYTFQVASSSFSPGTATVKASAVHPIKIDVAEI